MSVRDGGEEILPETHYLPYNWIICGCHFVEYSVNPLQWLLILSCYTVICLVVILQ